MRALWDAQDPLKVAEVTDRLEYPADLAYSTVMTVLVILCGKGLAARRRDGRAWRYTPTASRDDYLTSRIRDLVALSENPGRVLRNVQARPRHLQEPVLLEPGRPHR